MQMLGPVSRTLTLAGLALILAACTSTNKPAPVSDDQLGAIVTTIGKTKKRRLIPVCGQRRHAEQARTAVRSYIAVLRRTDACNRSLIHYYTSPETLARTLQALTLLQATQRGHCALDARKLAGRVHALVGELRVWAGHSLNICGSQFAAKDAQEAAALVEKRQANMTRTIDQRFPEFRSW